MQMPYGNNSYGGPQPSNNLWVGNNYSSGYSQMSRGYQPTNQTMPSFSMQNTDQAPRFNNIFQVMGPESAQAFQIGPDSQVILMDSNKPVFYMKKSDSSGYFETKAFEFKEIPLNQKKSSEQSMPQQDYVTKQDFEEYKKMIEELVMRDE